MIGKVTTSFVCSLRTFFTIYEVDTYSKRELVFGNGHEQVADQEVHKKEYLTKGTLIKNIPVYVYLVTNYYFLQLCVVF